MNVRVRRLGHVGIAVGNLDTTIEFYSGVLGLRLTERFTYPKEKIGHGTTVLAGAFMRCGATHHCLSFFVLADPDTSTPVKPRLGLHHLAFELATPEELVAKYDELAERGVTIVNARSGGPGNQPRFYALDPDGNLLEFYWGIDEIGWDGLPRAHPPIREIDLHAFDFADFEQRRNAARNRVAAVASEHDDFGTPG